MKKITLLLFALVYSFGVAQNARSIDAADGWSGYMNVFNVSDDSYVTGFAYGLADLKTTLSGSMMTLQPNFKIWQDTQTDAFYFDQSTGLPVKYPELISFVEDNSLRGSDLTFSGDVDSYTIDAGYTVKVFIKALDPANGFADTLNRSITLTSSSTDFSISATAAELGATLVIQYGFSVVGPYADPANEATLGSVVLSDPNGTVDPAPSDAPTAPPARDPSDVISIYGEAYGTEVGVSNVGWDNGSDSVEETHAGNKVLKMTFNDFLGLDLGSEVDASDMTHVHIDFWIGDTYTPGQVFKPKWSNHNGAGETDAFEYTYALGSSADSQQWLSIDVPITDYANALGGGPAARANLKQLVVGTSATLDLVYVDNVYFYKDAGSGGGGGGATGDLASWTFDDASSVNIFNGISSATEPTDESEISWNANGNGTGALQFQGINDGDPVAGRGFIYRYENATFDFKGNSEFKVSFDAKFDGAYAGAAFHFEVQVPNTTAGAGQVLVQNLDIQGQINGSSWSTLEFTISHPDFDGTNGLLIMDFQIAAGAGNGDGGTVLIDNLNISGTTASTNNENLIESLVMSNPTDTEWTIKTSNTNIKSVQVFNILGKQVYNATLDKDEVRIPAYGLSSGIYIARIQTELGSKSIKLIRN